jgi:hypothetical protein
MQKLQFNLDIVSNILIVIAIFVTITRGFGFFTEFSPGFFYASLFVFGIVNFILRVAWHIALEKGESIPFETARSWLNRVCIFAAILIPVGKLVKTLL